MTILQPSLLAMGEPSIGPARSFHRDQLSDTAWVERCEGWLGGADELFDFLRRNVPWRRGKRWMYERMVDDPRLSKHYPNGADLAHPVLCDIRGELSSHYGVPFGSIVLNYYRDGRDSVAFHRDRELRWLEDTLVCIVTLGGARPFSVRPLGGGGSHKYVPGSGDLLVMGGSCQLDWEHAVPKVVSAAPRISVSLRWSSKRGSLNPAGGGTRQPFRPAGSPYPMPHSRPR